MQALATFLAFEVTMNQFEQENSLVQLSFPTQVRIPAPILLWVRIWASRHIKSHVLPPFDRTLSPLDRECGQALFRPRLNRWSTLVTALLRR